MTAGLETFAKVRALHDSTTSPGEKAAAAGRMKKLARNAGMTVEQAKSKLDTPPPAASRNFFEDLFNTPEFQARNAERERARAEGRAAALSEYGSEDAVFADTEREAALRAACAPLTIWDQRPDWEGSYTLAGWANHEGAGKMPAPLREAIAKGWPMPETVATAWAEHQAAEAVENTRYNFCSDYTPHRWVEARNYLLEDMLDTHPAHSLNDLRARMSWLEWLSRRQSSWTHDKDLIRFATLRADIERMGARLKEEAASVQSGQGEGVSAGSGGNLTGSQVSGSPVSRASNDFPNSGGQGNPDPFGVQSGQPEGMAEITIPLRRTNADKRRDVLALLNAGNPGIAALTDREIARRAGVSPQTVGNIRRSLR